MQELRQLPMTPPPASADAPSWNIGGKIATLLFLLCLLAPPFYTTTTSTGPNSSPRSPPSHCCVEHRFDLGVHRTFEPGARALFRPGAYAMAYCLKLQRAAIAENREFIAATDMALPDFMAFFPAHASA